MLLAQQSRIKCECFLRSIMCILFSEDPLFYKSAPMEVTNYDLKQTLYTAAGQVRVSFINWLLF